VGVLCVDLFISGYDVYVNGLAPHPQNTGHYTVDFALTSQFEQQVRALCGQGLGDTTLSTPGAATVNLLGEMWEHGEPMWHGVFGNPSAHLHLYGNGEPRPGRRMGHLNVGADTALGATNLARRLRKLVKLDSPPA
jgi:5-(carboxyamino)imidazole ribonucleotide synthase